MSLTCYIVDDEPHAIEVLSAYIRQTPGLELSGSAVNPLVAIDEICRGTPPELTFLDIDMPQLNGLDVASLISSVTTVIFSTSFREYAPEAFEKEAAGYLVKPIEYGRFLGCITRIRKKLLLPSLSNLPAYAPFLLVKSGIKGKFNRITIADIRYIENTGNYIYIHSATENTADYLTLAELLARLPDEIFSRIHQSFIVNHTAIQSVEYAQIRLTGGITLPIGGTYRTAFRNKMERSMVISKREHPSG